MNVKYLQLGIMMAIEVIYFCVLLALGYYVIADQSLFEFALLIGGIWAWQRTGIFLSWRPAEIKAYLNDYQEETTNPEEHRR